MARLEIVPPGEGTAVIDITVSADGTVSAGPENLTLMAAWAVTQTGRFRATVMGAGITDWAMQVGVGELGRTDAGLTGSFGWEGPGPHRHDQLSPISYAAKVTTPITQFGTEHDLVIYPHENHSFTKRTHQIDVLERARSWFTRWLGRPGDS